MQKEGRTTPRVAKNAPGTPGGAVADEGGGVDGDGSRRRLGDRQQLDDLVAVKKAPLFHRLPLDERDHGVAAAEGEASDLAEGEKKRPKQFAFFLLRRRLFVPRIAVRRGEICRFSALFPGGVAF